MDAVVKEEEDGTDVKIEEEDEYQDVIPYEYRDYKEQHGIELQPVDIEKRKVEEASLKANIEKEDDKKYEHINPYEFEPKIELIDEMNVKVEQEDEYQDVIPYGYLNHNDVNLNGHNKIEEKEVKVEVDDNEYPHVIPHEYRDYVEQNTEKVQSRTTKAERKELAQCMKCDKFIAVSCFSHAKFHAVSHTNLKRFKCEKCDKGYWLCSEMQKHINRHHKNESCSVKEIQLSEEEQQELRKISSECFPGLAESTSRIIRINGKRFNKDGTPFVHKPTIEESRKGKDQCQKCTNFIAVNCFHDARKHAVTHTNLKRFKCEQCSYGSWYRDKVQRHISTQHNNESCSVKEMQLSEKEQLELKKLIEECFPDIIKALKRKLIVDEKSVKVEEDHSTISRKRPRTSDAD